MSFTMLFSEKYKETCNCSLSFFLYIFQEKFLVITYTRIDKSMRNMEKNV